jgi:hypothetical protein
MAKLYWLFRNQKLAALAALVALTYNNWLLGPFLNSNLFRHNGSISEYSVASQPSHWLFQSLDIISGGLLVLLGWRLWQRLKSHRSGWILAGGCWILGIANVFDAIFKLPCSETLNHACRIPVSLSLSNYQVPAHAYSSVLIGLCYLLLPLAGAILTYRHKLNVLLAASLVLIADDLFSLASVLEDYLRNGGPTTRTSGSGQQIQMLLLGAWLIICIFTITRINQRGALDSNQ